MNLDFQNSKIEKFLYIEWNSCARLGGGGVFHVRHFVQELVRFCLMENEGRAIIFSDRWFLNSRQHCPNIIPFIDFRNLYNFNDTAGVCSNGKEIKVFFDEEREFQNSFATSENVAVLAKSRAFKQVKKNNPHQVSFSRKQNIRQVLKDYNFVFWGYSRTPPSKNITLKTNLFGGSNQRLVNFSKQVIKNLGSEFYVVHLRTGDLAQLKPMVKNSADPEFVAKAIRYKFPANSKIYIMTDAPIKHVTRIIKALPDYKIVHRNNFPIFKQLWKINAFELFVCETFIFNRAKLALQNRKQASSKRVISLQGLFHRRNRF